MEIELSKESSAFLNERIEFIREAKGKSYALYSALYHKGITVTAEDIQTLSNLQGSIYTAIGEYFAHYKELGISPMKGYLVHWLDYEDNHSDDLKAIDWFVDEQLARLKNKQ